jgi:hypothetical protein
MTLRSVGARIAKLEIGRLPPPCPDSWADRLLRASAAVNAPATHATIAARDLILAAPHTAGDAAWLARARLSRDPSRPDPWLLELRPPVLVALAAVQSTRHPDPARACWGLLEASTAAVVNECSAALTGGGHAPLHAGQADRDLARWWSHATGAWPAPEIAAKLRTFIAGGPPPGAAG